MSSRFDPADYIAKAHWQFAVTMPEWPHEYTVKAWRREWSAEFEAFCWLLTDQGIAKPWPPPPAQPIYHNRYLVIGDHTYWAMGPHGDLDPPDQMTVINRERSRKPDDQHDDAQPS